MANEKRLIDANELLQDARRATPFLACLGDIVDLEILVNDQTTVDAVEVVHGEWIPVSERLPENMDDRVLVLLPTKSYHYPIGNQHIDTDRYRGEYRKWVRYGDKVTHWMPLPEPPKEG